MTATACGVLAFVRQSIRFGVETIQGARSFVEGLEGLTSTERLFLESALSRTQRLEEFYAAFVLRRKRRQPQSFMHRSGGARSGLSRRSHG